MASDFQCPCCGQRVPPAYDSAGRGVDPFEKDRKLARQVSEELVALNKMLRDFLRTLKQVNRDRD